MLTINLIREKKEFIIERLKIKNFDAEEIINKILALDTSRREIQFKADLLQSDLNRISKEIGSMMKEGRKDDADAAREKTYSVKEEIKYLSDKLLPLENELRNEIIRLPNLPHSSVAPGYGADNNVKVKESGVIPVLPGSALPHWDLIKKYDVIDFDLGIKLTGAGFPVYKGKGAKLERALINFFLDEGVKAGYIEIMPPVMVNEDSGFGTGQLPDKEGQMYNIGLDGFYLIPTAEVPVTNIYRDVILNADQLPVKNVAYTPCFRREAGSWGAHVRGLNRLHQFDKVEKIGRAHV
jgi:seryl-tRNA synthetase